MDHPLVQVETTIAVSPQAVWDTIVGQPSTLFMGAKVETDWKVGHPISMSGEFKGHQYKDTGEICSFDKERELSFTHFSSASGKPQTPDNTNLVKLTLAPDGAGTKVSLSQTPLGEPGISDQQKAEFTKNWSTMLDALKAQAEGSS